jgi:DNA polymerase III delta prime subunit
MSSTRLILFEGLPGSGKTTTAQLIAQHLAQQGHSVKLCLEGDWEHPADFESVACLNALEFAGLKQRFPQQTTFLESHAVHHNGDFLFQYRKLQHTQPETVHGELFEALAFFETYERPPEKFHALLLDRWQTFARQAAQAETIYCFECCFFQNPLTFDLARNHLPVEEAQAFILSLAQAIQPLNPRLVYLDLEDIPARLEVLKKERPQEWLDFVIQYHTGQGTGLARGWSGENGLLNFYQLRREVELKTIDLLPFPVLRVPFGENEQRLKKIYNFL